jgi:uncharacterized protein YbbC (DUF1343 family)
MSAKSFTVKPENINKLWLNNHLTQLLQGKSSLKKILKEMNTDEALFRKQREPYLLYD